MGLYFFIMKNLFIKIRVWFIARKIRKMYFKIILAFFNTGGSEYSEIWANEALYSYINKYYNEPILSELYRQIPLGKPEE